MRKATTAAARRLLLVSARREAVEAELTRQERRRMQEKEAGMRWGWDEECCRKRSGVVAPEDDKGKEKLAYYRDERLFTYLDIHEFT